MKEVHDLYLLARRLVVVFREPFQRAPYPLVDGSRWLPIQYRLHLGDIAGFTQGAIGPTGIVDDATLVAGDLSNHGRQLGDGISMPDSNIERLDIVVALGSAEDAVSRVVHVQPFTYRPSRPPEHDLGFVSLLSLVEFAEECR